MPGAPPSLMGAEDCVPSTDHSLTAKYEGNQVGMRSACWPAWHRPPDLRTPSPGAPRPRRKRPPPLPMQRRPVRQRSAGGNPRQSKGDPSWAHRQLSSTRQHPLPTQPPDGGRMASTGLRQGLLRRLIRNSAMNKECQRPQIRRFGSREITRRCTTDAARGFGGQSGRGSGRRSGMGTPEASGLRSIHTSKRAQVSHFSTSVRSGKGFG